MPTYSSIQDSIVTDQKRLWAEISLLRRDIERLKQPPSWIPAPLSIGGSSPEDAPFIVDETGVTTMSWDGQQLKAPVATAVSFTSLGTTVILSESATGVIHKLMVVVNAVPILGFGNNATVLRITVDGGTAYDMPIYDVGATVFNSSILTLGYHGTAGTGSVVGDKLVFEMMLPFKESLYIAAIVSGTGGYASGNITVTVWRSYRVL